MTASNPDDLPRDILILGAGPAGMACAYELASRGVKSVVIDRNAQAGGMCRTLKFDDFLFDIGGHRFLSRSEEVNQLWRKILGDDLLKVPRISHIYFRKHFFSYPLEVRSTVRNLGFFESARCVLSFIKAKLFGREDLSHFQGWMIKRFGRRLFELFFKTYTEKVWGIPCDQISSDWAAQRIQGLSLGSALKKAFFPGSSGHAKSLTQEFWYPRLGPGMFYDEMRKKTEENGGEFRMNEEVKAIFWEKDKINAVEIKGKQSGAVRVSADHFFSSLPLPLFIEKMQPLPDLEIIQAARGLKFRSLIVVYLIIAEAKLFSDHWIYVHAPEVTVGRIQNYKNWSAEMCPDPAMTSLGMEYFVSEGDGLWCLTDQEMIAFALDELCRIGIVKPEKFVKGYCVRVPNAYPIYSPGYQDNLNKLKRFVDGFSNLDCLGRSGLFRYNNSDHALLTGLYGARKLLGEKHSLWDINVDGYD